MCLYICLKTAFLSDVERERQQLEMQGLLGSAHQEWNGCLHDCLNHKRKAVAIHVESNKFRSVFLSAMKTDVQGTL